MVKLYARRVECPRVSWPVPGRTQVTVAVSGEAAASAREVTGPGAVSTCTVFSVYRSCECVQGIASVYTVHKITCSCRGQLVRREPVLVSSVTPYTCSTHSRHYYPYFLAEKS